MSMSRKILIGVGVVSVVLILKGDGPQYAEWLHHTFDQVWAFVQAL